MQRCYHQKNTNTEQKSSNTKSKKKIYLNTEQKTLIMKNTEYFFSYGSSFQNFKSIIAL